MMQRLNGTNPLARYDIATGSTIGCGDLVALNGEGKAVPAADTAGLRVIGVAVDLREGQVEVEVGVFSFANASTNGLSRADRGSVAYVKDKATLDSVGGTNKIAAGIVVDVCDGEVYCDVTAAALAAARLLAAAAVAAAVSDSDSGSATASGSGTAA